MKNYRWLKIDTAAIMFSALSSESWGRTFRFSAYFKEDIDVSAVRQACEDLRPVLSFRIYVSEKRVFLELSCCK